jgi:hypothetical protein
VRGAAAVLERVERIDPARRGALHDGVLGPVAVVDGDAFAFDNGAVVKLDLFLKA